MSSHSRMTREHSGRLPPSYAPLLLCSFPRIGSQTERARSLRRVTGEKYRKWREDARGEKWRDDARGSAWHDARQGDSTCAHCKQAQEEEILDEMTQNFKRKEVEPGCHKAKVMLEAVLEAMLEAMLEAVLEATLEVMLSTRRFDVRALQENSRKQGGRQRLTWGHDKRVNDRPDDAWHDSARGGARHDARHDARHGARHDAWHDTRQGKDRNKAGDKNISWGQDKRVNDRHDNKWRCDAQGDTWHDA